MSLPAAIGENTQHNADAEASRDAPCAERLRTHDEDRKSFAEGLEQRLLQVEQNADAIEINHIDHRFCCIIRSVLDKKIFRRNQLAHAVARYARNIFTIRILKYDGELGCVFSNQHTRLVSVKLSRERINMDTHNVPVQTIQVYPPIVMQMHMAHLLRCICVLQTWYKFNFATSRAREIQKWSRAVHQSYITLLHACEQLPAA